MIEFIVKYLLDEDFINSTFLILAFACPLLGFLVGIILDKLKATGYKYLILGLSIGFLGTLNYILWKLYCIFTEYLGLTTVKNLLFNLIFFVILGVLLGFLFTLLWRFLYRKEINEIE